MRYGLPYKGSKSKYAREILDVLPPARHFYDLFAGGCSMTHCALTLRKYAFVHANDVSPVPQLFLDAVHGRFRNERRWISRAEFMERRYADPYISLVWSFGNNGYNYLYSEELEPYKRACHYAVVFDDWGSLRELCPEVSEAAAAALAGLPLQDTRRRRIAFGRAVVRRLKEIGSAELVMSNPLYRSCHWKKPKGGAVKDAAACRRAQVRRLETGGLQSLESLQRLESLQSLERLESLQSLERLESLQSLESLERLESLESLTVTQKDYRDVRFRPDSVVYCDIPYEGAEQYYTNHTAGAVQGFDYPAFYDWAARQERPTFVSSYALPADRFTLIWERQTISTLGHSGTPRTERLYIPRHQRYASRLEPDLFGQLRNT